MKLTVPFPVSDSPITQGSLLSWVNNEAMKVLRLARAALNFLMLDRQTVTTAADGVATTAWTSEALPTDGSWLLLQLVSGCSTSGVAQRCGYVRAALFESTAGTVAQVSTTTTIASFESAAALTSAFSVDAAARKVSVTVTDDSTSPMKFEVVVIGLEARRR